MAAAVESLAVEGVLDSVASGDGETFAADGPALMSEDACDDEEILADDQGQASDPFESALSELEVLMMDEGLNARVEAFTRAHCGEFEPGDENKLEYTARFAEYTSMVEQYIERQIGASVASFDMASFCATLAERARTDEALLDHPALEMLFAYSDFEAFKSLMLATREGANIEASGGLLCVSGDKLGTMDVAFPDAEADGDDDETTGEFADGLNDALCISAVKSK